MRNFIIILSVTLSLAIAGVVGANDQDTDYQVVTGHLPPYSVIEDGQISGLAADIVKELIVRIKYDHEIITEPWPRVVKSSNKAGIERITFPIVRNDQREKRYKWICPLLNDRATLAVRAENKTVFNRIEDFKPMRIGVIRGAQTEALLNRMGFAHVDPVTTIEQNLKKLLAGRIDAWFEAELMIKYSLRKMKIDDSRIRIAFRRPEVTMYLVASLDIPDDVITLWRNHMERMISDGTYQRILKKYDVEPDFSSNND